MNTLSYKTVSANKETVQKEWFVVDATDEVLGRLASKVAIVLRGKHKPSFTPHVDCGDYVVVINADKVRVTGRKMDQKMYYRHSGYMGGEKHIPFKRMLETHPDRIIEVAVNCAPSNAWPGSTPITVSGIGAMMTSGTVYDRNCPTTSR